MSKVKDLTVDELRLLIEQMVEHKLVELFGDPDEGLELREEVKARLRRSTSRECKGVQGIPAKEVAKNLGLEW
ncbi:hypothetical protein HYR54_05720 [Candidatus Acetothermia bacterium]|nr:hypothetical protein [Candidatus Acetothermia bacterium]